MEKYLVDGKGFTVKSEDLDAFKKMYPNAEKYVPGKTNNFSTKDPSLKLNVMGSTSAPGSLEQPSIEEVKELSKNDSRLIALEALQKSGVKGAGLAQGAYGFFSNLFSDDVEVGHWTFWYYNGNKRMEGNFRYGEFHGDWSFYTPDGKIAFIANYKNGRLIDRRHNIGGQ